MAQQITKWSHRNNRSVHSLEWKNSSEVYRLNNNVSETQSCGTPDPTLTNLLYQPSTITCCDRFDRNCVNIINTEPPTPTKQHIENSIMVDPMKGCAEINLHDPSLLPTFECTLQYMEHAKKCITGTQTFPVSKLGG